MTTLFTHPAVAQYLAELDAALRSSPGPHADDLGSQVREHLEDALGPDATDIEIDNALARLGPPADLAAESVLQPSNGSDVASVRRAFLVWLQSRTWRWWLSFATAVVVVVAGTTVWIIERSVAGVQLNCEVCDWYTPVDLAHRKFTRPFDSHIASDVQQLTVPLRVGTPQEFVYTVWNPSRLTQRLIGGPLDPGTGPTVEHFSLSFSTTDPGTVHGIPDQLSYQTSVSIPPHSLRLVRESWTTDCNSSEVGSSGVVAHVMLRVRALGITRHESLQLPAVFQTVVTSAGPRCRFK